MTNYSGVKHKISSFPSFNCYGYVHSIIGNCIKVDGIAQFSKIGDICNIQSMQTNMLINAEIIGFDDSYTILIPQDNIDGIGPGDQVNIVSHAMCIYPCDQWLGKVLDANANVLEDAIHNLDKSPEEATPYLAFGRTPYFIKQPPLEAHLRKMLTTPIDWGVRSLNTFTTTCYGQRMGIFAGSGVGKSMLMAQLAKNSTADINIIGLIGERGREVSEFIHKYMGQAGMQKSIVVVSTSDQSPVLRKQAAHTTLTIAEYFRDQGNEVLCILDSVTRFAMSLREIGLLRGEPPTTKGYPPSVFSELPKLLERAGPGKCNKKGNITGLFTVLVEGNDHDEVIADTIRGILDGHIVLDRNIAQRGRFPAINITKSISRAMPDCNTQQQHEIFAKAKSIIASYEDMEDMIKIGAYNPGSNPALDNAINLYPQIEQFLHQGYNEKSSLEEGFNMLQNIIQAR